MCLNYPSDFNLPDAILMFYSDRNVESLWKPDNYVHLYTYRDARRCCALVTMLEVMFRSQTCYTLVNQPAQ